MKIVAIIPARGGSKGLPHKNITPFCGHPLIAWTISAARKCRLISHVIVSTDSSKIARISQKYGAKIIRRPANIAADHSTSEAALIHAIKELSHEKIYPDGIVFLQATSPLRESDELTKALRKFSKEKLDSLFSASSAEDLLLWQGEKNGVMSFNYDYHHRKRRQDMPMNKRLWIETGSFYIMRTRLLLKTKNRLGGKMGIWKVPLWKSFEIDSMEGLSVCENLMHIHKLDRVSPSLVSI